MTDFDRSGNNDPDRLHCADSQNVERCDALAALLAAGTRFQVEPGGYLFRQNEGAGRLYFVEDGELHVFMTTTGTDLSIDRLGSGDLVCYDCFGRYSASCVALNASQVIAVEHTTNGSSMPTDHQFWRFRREVCSHERDKKRGAVERLLTRAVAERLWSTRPDGEHGRGRDGDAA